ncbi:MAG: ATP-binding protein [Planctomycetes bacterium]|nr:ATP-binding protein [Planctomycetota bacterium]
MQKRTHWLEVIERSWRDRSVLWLSGVRRVGKTTLCRSLDDIEYFDCELPRTRRLMDDPEAFLKSLRGKRIVLDEIHRLRQPSEILKIAADHFPTVRVLATGSSTLAASRKFKDTLTGRKTELWLTPADSRDLAIFGVADLRVRLRQGGLPPFLLAADFPERDFQEWLDSYWAKDIQELFRIERRHSFLRFTELLLASSGGIFEATRFAGPCEVSRTTIASYLSVLEATSLAHVLRPYATSRTAEIVSAPKVYGFDTGFVCHVRGWDTLRTDDLGTLWEHFVLNELHARLQTHRVQYWRDKQGREVDFVLGRRGRPPIAIECKWSADQFEPAALLAFAARYPEATAFVVAHDVERAHRRTIGGVSMEFVGLAGLLSRLEKPRDP